MLRRTTIAILTLGLTVAAHAQTYGPRIYEPFEEQRRLELRGGLSGSDLERDQVGRELEDHYRWYKQQQHWDTTESLQQRSLRLQEEALYGY